MSALQLELPEDLRAKLAQVQKSHCSDLLANRDPDVRKLYVTYKLLQLRRSQPRWFDEQARYVPLHAEGHNAHRVLAFMRGSNVLVVVPRLTARLKDQWGDTRIELPQGAWENVLCGVQVNSGLISELFAEFPLAVLIPRPR